MIATTHMELHRASTSIQRPPPVAGVLATILFTDIVNSTVKAGQLGDHCWSALLDAHDQLSMRYVTRHRGHWIKNTGDGILATFDEPRRGIASALEILEGGRTLGVELRAGLHTGRIGRRRKDVAGLSVHIAARVTSLAGPGEVLVTGTTRDMTAGTAIRFDDRGMHQLKGVPGDWPIAAVVTEPRRSPHLTSHC